MSNRFLLYIAFTLVIFMIWQQWKIEQNPSAQNQNIIVEEEDSFGEQDLPEEATSEQSSQKARINNISLPKKANNTVGENIIISNNDLQIVINTLGGTIKEAKLLEYFESTDPNSESIKLLDYQKDFYIAQSGLLHDKNLNNKNENKLAPNHHDVFIVKSKKNNSLTLEWTNLNKDITVLKKIYLDDTGYEINIENTVINKSEKAWAGRQYRQIRRKSAGEGRSWVTPTFTGGAFYDGTYNKISYSEISEKKPKFNVQSGWIAMMEHYFVSAWFFPKDENNLFYTKEILVDDSRRDYIIGARSEATLIQPSESAVLKSNLYVGPKLQKELEKLAEGLELTIDYGVLTFISKPLFWLLDKIYSFVGNWGWSIILLTLLIKLAFYKLSEASYRSMAKMKQFSPKIQSIRERYGSDRQKMNQAMMDMYRQEKINQIGRAHVRTPVTA